MSTKLINTVKFGCMAAVLLFAVPAPSATPGNLTVTDHPGGSLKVGRKDTSDIFAIEHILIQSFDPVTGFPDDRLPTFGPLTVVKHIDKATPGLHKALTTGEKIEEVTLDFYRIDPSTRAETKYYVISLVDARVTSIELFMPMTFLPQNESFGHMEKVSFVYRSVQWEWIPDDIIDTPPDEGIPTATGDSNRNGRVDLHDFASLQRCFPLPSAGSFTCLYYFDFDLDHDITMDDYAEFNMRLTGP